MIGHVRVVGERRCVGIKRRTALDAEIRLVIAEDLPADIPHAIAEIDFVREQVRRDLTLPARIAQFTELTIVERFVGDVGEVVPLDHVGKQTAQTQIETVGHLGAIRHVGIDARRFLLGEVERRDQRGRPGRRQRHGRAGLDHVLLALEGSVRIAEDGRTVLVVDARRTIIALIDHGLAAQREDDVVDRDVVIIDRQGEARQEARFEHGAEGPAFAAFLPQVRVASVVRRNARCGHVRERFGGAVERLRRGYARRSAIRAAVGVVVDAVLAAGVDEPVDEGLRRGGEQIALGRRADRAGIATAELDVVDRSVDHAAIVSPDTARLTDIVIGIARGTCEAQFPDKGNIGHDRNVDFTESFGDLLLGRIEIGDRVEEGQAGAGGLVISGKGCLLTVLATNDEADRSCRHFEELRGVASDKRRDIEQFRFLHAVRSVEEVVERGLADLAVTEQIDGNAGRVVVGGRSVGIDAADDLA